MSGVYVFYKGIASTRLDMSESLFIYYKDDVPTGLGFFSSRGAVSL